MTRYTVRVPPDGEIQMLTADEVRALAAMHNPREVLGPALVVTHEGRPVLVNGRPLWTDELVGDGLTYSAAVRNKGPKASDSLVTHAAALTTVWQWHRHKITQQIVSDCLSGAHAKAAHLAKIEGPEGPIDSIEVRAVRDWFRHGRWPPYKQSGTLVPSTVQSLRQKR